MALKRAASTVEWAAYIAIVVVLSSGLIDKSISIVPFVQYAVGALAIAALVDAFVRVLRKGSDALSYTWAGLLAAAAAATSHVSTVVAPADVAVFRYAYLLYYIVIVMTALSPRLGLWLSAYGLIALGELGGPLARQFALPADASADPMALVNSLQALAGLLAGLAAAGCAVWLLTKANMRRWHRSVAPQAHAEAGPSASQRARITTHGVDSAVSVRPGSPKTQSFTIEELSGIHHEHQASMHDVLSSVVYFMSRNFAAHSALGFTFDPAGNCFVLDSFHSKSISVTPNARIPMGVGVVGEIGTRHGSFMSGDITLYNLKLGYYSQQELVNSVMAVPIVSDRKVLLGVLVVDSKDKNAFNDRHKETLNRFSSIAAALITNVRMRFYQEQVAKNFQVFYEASQRFTTTLKTQEIFEVLLTMLSQMVPVSRAMALSYDPGRSVCVVERIVGNSPDIAQGFEFAANSGMYSYALRHRQTVSIPDLRQHQNRYYRLVPEEQPNPGIAAIIILPLVDDEARCLGLISLESNQPGLFGGDVEPLLSTLVGNASVAYNRALLYQRMEMLATTDGLTGLPNHRTFQERLAIELERGRRYHRPVSLALMDIDHFKSFNDTYGHPVGDLVLKEIAGCIKRALRVTDTPARYGGEEFVVVMPETDENSALITAERIRKSIEAHEIDSVGKKLKVTVSIGCASYPALAQAQTELIDNSDKAMYYSKEHGRNQVTLFQPGMTSEKKKK